VEVAGGQSLLEGSILVCVGHIERIIIDVDDDNSWLVLEGGALLSRPTLWAGIGGEALQVLLELFLLPHRDGDVVLTVEGFLQAKSVELPGVF
jgi:hypothetical protein